MKLPYTGRAVYAVQLDDKTGKLFWYEPRDNGEPKEIYKASGQILNSILFETTEDSFITTGEIEIHFHGAV